MKLYERFTEAGYHTSISTTFGIDFDAYENIVLPRIKGAGCHNNILIADERMLTHALNGASAVPQQAGRIYTTVGAKSAGVFHPKLFLQLGRHGGRMIVSSANMTASGLAGNLELAEEIVCDNENSGEQQLISSAWNFVNSVLKHPQKPIADQLQWVRGRTPWLHQIQQSSTTGKVTLKDGTEAAFLATGGASGIAAQFAVLIGDDPITRMIIISPYWDHELSALSFLSETLSGPEVVIILDPEECQFPGKMLVNVDSSRVIDRRGFCEGRFMHAKSIIAQGSSYDHVLFGSANCTKAALGNNGFSGSNAEICLYRRLPTGLITEQLQIDQMLGGEHTISPSLLQMNEHLDDIPLESLADQNPGWFECRYDILLWEPANTLQSDEVFIELLDVNQTPINCDLIPLESRDQIRCFQVTNTDVRPAFARLKYPVNKYSGLAIVTVVDSLRDVVREKRSSRTESMAAQLSDETIEGLWLLEVLDTLEQEELVHSEKEVTHKPWAKRQNSTDEFGHGRYKKLSYEFFIANRRPRLQTTQVTHNSFSGSEFSLVRGFLNRVLGIKATEYVSDSDDDERLMHEAFDLGDESPDGDNISYSDSQPDAFQITASEDEKENEKRRLQYTQRKATKNQIVQANKEFHGRLKDRKSSGELTALDILRLRALLMIVLSAGWSESSNEKTTLRTNLQALPQKGLESWPRLLGQFMYALFGPKDPAIGYLRLDSEYDQIPDDLLECWATCFWCCQAALAAQLSIKDNQSTTKFLVLLTERVYKLTGLSDIDMLSSNIDLVFVRLGDRFSSRLGVDASHISIAHNKMVKKLFRVA